MSNASTKKEFSYGNVVRFKAHKYDADLKLLDSTEKVKIGEIKNTFSIGEDTFYEINVEEGGGFSLHTVTYLAKHEDVERVLQNVESRFN